MTVCVCVGGGRTWSVLTTSTGALSEGYWLGTISYGKSCNSN